MSKKNLLPVTIQSIRTDIGSLVRDAHYGDEKSIAVAKNEDEAVFQVMMMISLGRTLIASGLLPIYFQNKILSKEKVKMLGALLLDQEFKQTLCNLCYLKDKEEDEKYVLPIHELIPLIISGHRHISADTALHIIRVFNVRKERIPLTLLQEWLNKEFSWGIRDGRSAALLAIEVFNRGDTEIVTAESITEALERLTTLEPHSHGIHRFISLLGYAARERKWDLIPYAERISSCMFKLLLYSLRCSEEEIKRGEIDFMLGILIEILASYENQELTDRVMLELEQQINTYRINLSTESLRLAKIYAKSIKK